MGISCVVVELLSVELVTVGFSSLEFSGIDSPFSLVIALLSVDTLVKKNGIVNVNNINVSRYMAIFFMF